RVKFIRESQTAVKTNEFLKYGKVLQLERYCANHEAEVERRRKLRLELRKEMQEKKDLLNRLTLKTV
ncbi:hypothetical protein HDU91_002671, partial [Kappamyces sp. JEL0680]